MMGIINNKINVTFVSLLRTVCNNAKYMRHALIHTVYNSILSCPCKYNNNIFFNVHIGK